MCGERWCGVKVRRDGATRRSDATVRLSATVGDVPMAATGAGSAI
jgi:hypothetical protein